MFLSFIKIIIYLFIQDNHWLNLDIDEKQKVEEENGNDLREPELKMAALEVQIRESIILLVICTN
jgi:hypothetical protein